MINLIFNNYIYCKNNSSS